MAESLRRLFSPMPHSGRCPASRRSPRRGSGGSGAASAGRRHVGADFENPPVFEQLQDGLGQRNLVEPEQVADCRRGELQQRYAERDARAERGARLGVEADDGLLGERFAGRGDVAFVFDDADLPRNSTAGSRAVCSLLILSMKLLTVVMR